MEQVKRSTILIALCLFLISCCKAGSKCDTLFVSTVFTEKNGFTTGIEGPAVAGDGNLYAVNFQKQGTIGKVTPQGVASLFLELPDGSIGNGIRFNSKGDMFIADYTGHNILCVDMNTKNIEVYAHEPAMNQPNDEVKR